MRNAAISCAVLLLGSVILGATAFREQVAQAAQAILPVRVMNTADEPVPVTQQGTVVTSDGSHAVQEGTFVFFPPDGTTATGDFTIPEGKRLNVRYVNAADSYAGQLVAIQIESNASQQYFWPKVVEQGGGWEVVSEQVFVSLEGTVQVTARRDVACNCGTHQGIAVDVFGTLEDIE